MDLKSLLHPVCMFLTCALLVAASPAGLALLTTHAVPLQSCDGEPCVTEISSESGRDFTYNSEKEAEIGLKPCTAVSALLAAQHLQLVYYDLWNCFYGQHVIYCTEYATSA